LGSPLKEGRKRSITDRLRTGGKMDSCKTLSENHERQKKSGRQKNRTKNI